MEPSVDREEHAREYARHYPKAKAMRAAVWARLKCRRYGLPEGTLTWRDYVRLQMLPCAYCGATPAGFVDHIAPLWQGGANSIENLAPACRSCNESKGARTPEEWAAAIAPYACADCPTLLTPRPGRTRALRCVPCRRPYRLRQLAAARLNSPIAKPLAGAA